MNKLTSALHDTSHQVPGVPDHQERLRGHQGSRRHRRSLQNRPLAQPGGAAHHAARTIHHNPPRVMVGWQNWLGTLLSRKTD